MQERMRSKLCRRWRYNLKECFSTLFFLASMRHVFMRGSLFFCGLWRQKADLFVYFFVRKRAKNRQAK